jgi:chitinase
MRSTLTILLAMMFIAFTAAAQTQPWVSAYYAGWMQSGYPPSAVDFGAMTHIIHFSLEPGNGGTVSGTGNGITPSASQVLVSAAHAAGKKVIVTVGGWGADGGFVNATNGTNRPTFIANLVNFMTTYSYDGIDIDWEPVTSPSQFALFIPELRAAMTAARPGSLLTIAVMGTDQAVIDMQSYFDQINLMTYDMSGAWQGWVTWHNSPIYDGGATFPSTGRPLPSANGEIDAYVAKGVPRGKLGIGTDFYGYVWSGVSQPRESWTTTPSVTDNVSCASLMSSYGSTPASWDSAAGAAYISITSPGKKFISLDNERTIQAKAEYVRTKGIGGIIIWEIGGGYRPSAPAGSRDVLLQAVKQYFMNGVAPASDTTSPTVAISSPAAGTSVSGTLKIQAQASDNVGVAGVTFQVDGLAVGNEIAAAPYAVSVNTWQWANGGHTLTAVARDWAGNSATAFISITVDNQGTPPATAPLVVFDDALKSPFRDASWSATVNYANTNPVMSGTQSVKVTFAAWGGFDMLSGNWNSEIAIDPTTYDTLRFDIYPTTAFPLTVGFYSTTVEIAAPPANQWTTIAVPTPPEQFTRFYIANNTGASRTATFDNIRFTGQGATKVPTSVTGNPELPGDFRLDQNYPNPFNPKTVVSGQLSVASRVSLRVFDLLGREVATLVDELKDAGTIRVEFDGSNLSSGIYICRMTVGSFTDSKRMVLMK